MKTLCWFLAIYYFKSPQMQPWAISMNQLTFYLYLEIELRLFFRHLRSSERIWSKNAGVLVNFLSKFFDLQEPSVRFHEVNYFSIIILRRMKDVNLSTDIHFNKFHWIFSLEWETIKYDLTLVFSTLIALAAS